MFSHTGLEWRLISRILISRIISQAPDAYSLNVSGIFSVALCFVLADAAIHQRALHKLVRVAVYNPSLNSCGQVGYEIVPYSGRGEFSSCCKIMGAIKLGWIWGTKLHPV
jgi:hypothetical protein